MQRSDDTAEALVSRLKAYHAQTVPVLKHYGRSRVYSPTPHPPHTVIVSRCRCRCRRLLNSFAVCFISCFKGASHRPMSEPYTPSVYRVLYE